MADIYEFIILVAALHDINGNLAPEIGAPRDPQNVDPAEAFSNMAPKKAVKSTVACEFSL